MQIIAQMFGPEQATRVVQNFFDNDAKLLIDNCAILTTTKYFCDIDYDISKINRSYIDISLAFADEMIKQLPLNKEKILIFPELRQEYYDQLRITENHLKRQLQEISQQNNTADNLDAKLKKYARKIRRLDYLTESYCKKEPEHNKLAGIINNFLLYLNQRFQWKEETGNRTDEKITAHALSLALSGEPIEIYSNDRHIFRFMKYFLNLVACREIYPTLNKYSKDICFQLLNADLSIFSWQKRQGRYVKQIKNKEYMPKTRKMAKMSRTASQNKEKIINTINEYMTKIHEVLKTNKKITN